MYTLSNYVKNVILLIKIIRNSCLFFIILDVSFCGTVYKVVTLSGKLPKEYVGSVRDISCSYTSIIIEVTRFS